MRADVAGFVVARSCARAASTRRKTSRPRALLKVAAALALGAPMLPALAADVLQNWFNDPFFAVSAAIPDCPLPAGPFVDDADKRVQAHRRAEKGTTCWLAKECDRPNAYIYDPDIAAEIQAAVRERHPFEGTSLWVTVQGRVVYIEGCAKADFDPVAAEAFIRALPHVQQAIAIVRTDPSQRAPYKLRVPG